MLTFGEFTQQWLDQHATAHMIANGMKGLIYLMLILTLVKTSIAAKRMSMAALWLSRLDDEFYNYANALGYKIAFLVMLK